MSEIRPYANLRNLGYGEYVEIYQIGKAWFVDIFTLDFDDIEDERFSVYSSDDESEARQKFETFLEFSDRGVPVFD